MYVVQGSIEVTLGEPGPLTNSLLTFFHDVNMTTKTGAVNPSPLFTQVGILGEIRELNWCY